MKKRIALATVLAMLLMGTGMGALPGEAATRNADRQTAVYGRVNMVSSSTPTPPTCGSSAPQAELNTFPALRLRQASIEPSHAWRRCRAPRPLRATSCTAVPDNFGRADFTTACDDHDDCYAPDSTTDRAECDLQLLLDLRAACSDAYGKQPGPLLTCFTVAAIYYVGVRLFGASFYQSKTGSTWGPINDGSPCGCDRLPGHPPTPARGGHPVKSSGGAVTLPFGPAFMQHSLHRRTSQ